MKSAKFVGTHFLQNTNQWLLLIIAVSIVVKGELANKTVNYDAKAKGYVLKTAVQVKEQVSEAAVRRLQIMCS